MHDISCNSSSETKRTRIFFFLLTAVIAAAVPPVMAGPNDFFGSTMPGTQSGLPNNPPSDISAPSQFTTPGQAKAADMLNGAGPGDYTDDEKRMQKKYKVSVSHARGLIAKGDRMMKSPDQKESKKGKILKEIGEKRLAELEANNPIPHENRIPDNDKFKEKKAVAE